MPFPQLSFAFSTWLKQGETCPSGSGIPTQRTIFVFGTPGIAPVVPVRFDLTCGGLLHTSMTAAAFGPTYTFSTTHPEIADGLWHHVLVTWSASTGMIE